MGVQSERRHAMCYEFEQAYWRAEEARRAREAEEKRKQAKPETPAKPAESDRPQTQPEPVPV
jgi:hypothetical protein